MRGIRHSQADVQLGELCERLTVGHVGPMANQYQSAGIPFLRSQDIHPFAIRTEESKFIDEEFNAKLKKSILKKGDVVIVRTGYPGTAAVVPARLDGANCADLVILTPGPNLDPWFTAALLNSSWGRGMVAGNLVGVAQQHFNVGAARALQFRPPDISVQRRIGEIIRTYCNLIEVNLRRIAILEEITRRLYDEWFVEFQFPGHDALQLLKTPLGPAPHGWTIAALQSFGEVQYGHPFKSKAFNVEGIGCPVIRIRDIKAGVSNTFTDEMARSQFLVSDGDILIGMDGEFHMAIWSGGEAWLNQRVARVRPARGIPTDFLFHLIYGPIKRLEASIVGTTVAHLSARDMNEIRVLLPAHDVIEQVAPLFDHGLKQRIILHKSNRKLRAARDLLLPKLISGEIDLERAERGVETVLVAAE